MPLDFNMSTTPGFVCLEDTLVGVQVPALGSCPTGEDTEPNSEILCADGTSLESNLSPTIRAALAAGGNANAVIIGVVVAVLLLLLCVYYRLKRACCGSGGKGKNSKEKSEYAKVPNSAPGFNNPVGPQYGAGYGGYGDPQHGGGGYGGGPQQGYGGGYGAPVSYRQQGGMYGGI
jgi:hypothetical protein